MSVLFLIQDEIRAPVERIRVKEEDGKLDYTLRKAEEECLLLCNTGGSVSPLCELIRLTILSTKARNDFYCSKRLLSDSTQLFSHI